MGLNYYEIIEIDHFSHRAGIKQQEANILRKYNIDIDGISNNWLYELSEFKCVPHIRNKCLHWFASLLDGDFITFESWRHCFRARVICKVDPHTFQRLNTRYLYFLAGRGKNGTLDESEKQMREDAIKEKLGNPKYMPNGRTLILSDEDAMKLSIDDLTCALLPEPWRETDDGKATVDWWGGKSFEISTYMANIERT